MAMRPFFGTQTIGGTNPQPVFGTSVTTAFAPPPDPYSGNLSPGSNETLVTIVVASTKGFWQGDNVLIGPAASFKPGIVAPGSIADFGTVKSVVDATHLIVQGLKKAHAASDWVVLDQPAGNIHIRPIVTAATVYIGNASTLSATDLSLMDELPITAAGAAPGYVFDAESIGMSQPFSTADFWIFGTAADTFLARYTTI